MNPIVAPVSSSLTPEEWAFARRLFEVFGQSRFTPRSYYRCILGGRARFTSEEDVKEIYRMINLYSRVLAAAPGARGDDGWRLSAAVLRLLQYRFK